MAENSKFEKAVKDNVIEEREEEPVSSEEKKNNEEVVLIYNFKTCFKKFKSIGKKKKGVTYSQWRESVKEQIKDYKDENLKNLVKQIEISKDAQEKENYFSDIFGFVSSNIPILTIFITALVAIYVPANSEAINIQLAAHSTQEIQEYANDMVHVITNNFLSFGEIIRDFSIILLIINTVVWIFSEISSYKKAIRVRYYTFLLKVLRDEDD